MRQPHHLVSYSTDPNQPINNVNWFQAQAYCQWRGAELPTEVQWEYASRGPDRLIFPWGDTFDGDQANHCDRLCGESSWMRHDYVHQEYDDGYAGYISCRELSNRRIVGGDTRSSW
ncbi:MAG UNVERIFIED_CONTAM: SUMF1/EgtB/PvdO family nonheme iron enzyme [Anaerolineae bacterium]